MVELFITVNIYTNGVTFSKVRNAYVRLCVANLKYSTGHVLAKYPLTGSIGTRGLVFAKLSRSGGNGWVITALGWGCGGPTASSTETLNVVQGITPPIQPVA